MVHMIVAGTKQEYKTDGENVWYHSSTKQAWVLDNMTPAIFNNILSTGNGYKI